MAIDMRKISKNAENDNPFEKEDELFNDVISLLLKIMFLFSVTKKAEGEFKEFEADKDKFFKKVSKMSLSELQKTKEKLENSLNLMKEDLKRNKGMSLKRLDTLVNQTRKAGKEGKTIAENLIVKGSESKEKIKERLKGLKFPMSKNGVGSVLVPIVFAPEKKGEIGHIFYAVADLNKDKSISVSIIDSHGDSKKAKDAANLFKCIADDIKVNEVSFQEKGRNDCGGLVLSGIEAFMDSEGTGRELLSDIENQNGLWNSMKKKYKKLANRDLNSIKEKSSTFVGMEEERRRDANKSEKSR